jgi:hypothetical protein
MQLRRTIFSDSVIFMVKKRPKLLLWEKVDKKCIIFVRD